MHTDELWQIYAPNGEPILGAGWKSAKDNPEVSGSSEIVGAVVVFLYRISDEGTLEFLWQKRGDGVSRYPGCNDISIGGHINLGESPIETSIREGFEEIGVSITEEDLEIVMERQINKNRLLWLYCVDWTDREENFSFDDGEVSEVVWVPYSEMEEFWQTKAKSPLQKDKLMFLWLSEWLKMHGYLKLDK